MILKNLLLRNFRNYNNESFEFTSKVNIIQGKNAQGKTALLEAIFLLSSGRSFRTKNLKELIKEDAKYFYIEANIITDLISQNIRIYYDHNKKKININNTSFSSFVSLFGLFPSIIHSPSDIFLITSSPSFRRKFLNLQMAQMDKIYIHHLIRFHRALKNRNFLLRNNELKNIEIWENEMAKSAAYITFARNNFISSLKKEMPETKDLVSIFYLPGLNFQKEIKNTYSGYLEQLKNNRNKDLFLKSTQLGPHRDDFKILINKKDAKIFASEGQKRSIVSNIKMAQHKILCNHTQKKAIFSIDDINMHLDEERQNFLLQNFSSNSFQTFITTPTFCKNLEIDKNYKFITIENGKIIY